MKLIANPYPRARDNRLPFSHPLLKAARPKFFKAAILTFVTLQVGFFAIFCYIYGSLYQQGRRTHNLHVLWVDFDGGVIGQAVRNAYASLKGSGFPTLVEKSTAEYPSAQSMYEAVCSTNYWASLYTVAGSSANLGLAVAGINSSAYNPADVLVYVWNQARYPTVMDGAISANLNALSDAARTAYFALNGTAALSTIPANNEAAMTAFTTPWVLSSINIKPTVQGTRVIYNTITIVLILMQDFFYLATINGLYAQFKVYTRAPPTRIMVNRTIISTTYTMVGSMLVAGTIWAFKVDWDVTAGQFALTWLTLWLFAHVNFLMLDVFTIWIPPSLMPLGLISWIMLNVASILLPFSLSSPFYRIGYAFPAHSAYEILTDVWSGGCSPSLYYALPILFSYEVLGTTLTSLGVFKRCHMAVVAEEAGMTALALRRPSRPEDGQDASPKRRESAAISPGSAASETPITRETAGGSVSTAVELDKSELGAARREEEEQNAVEMRRLESRASRVVAYPAFRLVGADDDSDD